METMCNDTVYVYIVCGVSKLLFVCLLFIWGNSFCSCLLEGEVSTEMYLKGTDSSFEN